MTRLVSIAVGVAAVFAATAACADSGPVVVIPSRPGIPVIIKGIDASFAIVEGDWGLARPGHGEITVIGGRPVLPTPVYTQRNSYVPRYGRPPPRGRLEVEPPADRLLPPMAETFSRSWSTASDVPIVVVPSNGPAPRVGNAQPTAPYVVGSDIVPPTIVDEQTFYQPPVVVTPRGRRRP
jgi:hypothetical protein